MYAYINPKALKNIKLRRPEIRNINDLKDELNTEWVNSWMFADDRTIKSFKNFIEKPNEKTFSETILSMRKDLWGKKTNLPIDTFSLKTPTG